MNSAPPITVLLAEDHHVVREGLRMLLGNAQDITVIGEAANGRQAVEMTRSLRPEIVIMDIAMPGLNGLEATRLISAECPESKVIILSAHSDDAYVDHVMACGARGYLIKQSTAHELADAIRHVHKGNICFSPPVSSRHRHRHQTALDRKGRTRVVSQALTPREREVLQLVAEGRANKQIADDLGISIKTVEKHRDHLMQKLEIHDTAGLTRYAISAGVIESPGRPIPD